MKKVSVLFQLPRTWIGRICWRTEDPWSHSAVIIGDVQYDAMFFTGVVKNPLDIVPADTALHFLLADDKFEIGQAYLERELGRPYDWLSMIGFAFGIKEIGWKRFVYCHEYVRNFFVEMGMLESSNEEVHAVRLMRELKPLALREETAIGVVAPPVPETPPEPQIPPGAGAV